MSIYIILYQEVFQQIYSQFCFDSFLFWLFSCDTIQVLMSVCPLVSELHFYGCCHPCFLIKNTLFSDMMIYFDFINHFHFILSLVEVNKAILDQSYSVIVCVCLSVCNDWYLTICNRLKSLNIVCFLSNIIPGRPRNHYSKNQIYKIIYLIKNHCWNHHVKYEIDRTIPTCLN